MTSPAPRISVVVPAYNAAKFLPEAIESITSQSLAPSEIIVVDDGSKDDTLSIAQALCDQVVVQENQGAGAARNAGVSASSGDYLAFLDADDLWSPDKLSWQWNILESNSALDMVFGHVQQFVSTDCTLEEAAAWACPTQPMPGYLPGTVLVRRSAFDQVGPFRTDLTVGETIDWYVRAIETGLKGHLMQEVILHRRVHGQNQTLQHRDAQRDYLRVVKASLDRRRRESEVS